MGLTLRAAEGTASVIMTQLRQNTHYPNPYYVWTLQRSASGQMYVFCADNFSNSPYYDAFTVSNLSGSATAGYIPLQGGQYTYRVYEKQVPYDLSIGSTNSMVGTGIFRIGLTYSEIISYTGSTPINMATYKDF